MQTLFTACYYLIIALAQSTNSLIAFFPFFAIIPFRMKGVLEDYIKRVRIKFLKILFGEYNRIYYIHTSVCIRYEIGSSYQGHQTTRNVISHYCDKRTVAAWSPKGRSGQGHVREGYGGSAGGIRWNFSVRVSSPVGEGIISPSEWIMTIISVQRTNCSGRRCWMP